MNSRFPVVLSAVLAASAVLGAEQRPVFRAEVNYVEIDASVTDKQGNFVTGLKPSDFVLEENFKKQPIDVVDYVDLGAKAAAPAPGSEIRVRPDLSTQLPDLKGRVYLLYFNMSSPQSLVEVGAQARIFIEDFVQPGDLVGLWNSDAMSQTLTFTTDKAELLKSLPPEGHVANGGVQSGKEIGKLADAVAFLGGIQGRRKALILFSPGWPASNFGQFGANAAASIPWTNTTPGGSSNTGPITPSWNTPSEITGRSDVQIYTVDSRGLMAPPMWPRGHQQLANGLDSNGWTVDMLRSIADQTGGLAIFNTNDYRPGFAKIVDDNSRYYVLGYSSAVKAGWHRFVPVDVKVKQPGLTVRARKGYFTH
jgi:VWFA-related protein